jgi:Helix-turn-helix
MGQIISENSLGKQRTSFNELLEVIAVSSGNSHSCVARRIGVAKSTYSYWISGLHTPRRANFEALLEALRLLGISAAELDLLAWHYLVLLETIEHGLKGRDA